MAPQIWFRACRALPCSRRSPWLLGDDKTQIKLYGHDAIYPQLRYIKPRRSHSAFRAFIKVDLPKPVPPTTCKQAFATVYDLDTWLCDLRVNELRQQMQLAAHHRLPC